MSLPRYPEYKDSGVTWIGDVPAHWKMVPLKRLFQIVGGSTPKSDQSEYWDGDVVWVSPADLSKLKSLRVSDSARKITSEGVASCGTTIVPPGSLVLSTRAPIGSLAIADVELCTNQGCKSLVPTATSDADFYAYMLLASTEQLNLRGKGTTFLELSADELGAFRVVRPQVDEQRAIATFLDRETAKIDALIAEQEKLLALLAEKRQATISHAVTRGLNLNAPMKDSGIPWLGEVPAHWKRRKLLDLAAREQHAFVNGPFGSDLLTSELVTEGVPVVYIRDIKEPGYLRVSEWHVTNEKAAQIKFCCVIPDDVIIAKVGDPPGLAAVYPHGEPDGIVTQDVIRLRVDRASAAPAYLRWLLNSDYGRALVDDISVESTRTRVGLGEYKQLRFFIPPVEEQQGIADVLEHSVSALAVLKAAAEGAIGLLRERRSALISAAVTGKIDVRHAA